MPERQKFRVYLAGPISGCNPIQKHRWRNEVRLEYDEHLDFIDPSVVIHPEGGVGDRGATNPSEIVETDLLKIEDADGLLVNMWRESIGTTCGVVHAKRAGKPVVVADPNDLGNKTLAFYADAVVTTPQVAAETLLNILRAEVDWRVLKSTGELEQFERPKLAAAIRAACRGAERDSIVAPGFILPAVINRLKESNPTVKNQFPSSLIDKEVLEALNKLENDPFYQPWAIQGVSTEWKRVRDSKHRDRSSHAPRSGVTPSSATNCIHISTAGNHRAIWGEAVDELDDIPSAESRRVFQLIWEVPGITRIKLGRKSRGRRSVLAATVNEPRTERPCVIEGKLFDPKGTDGTIQMFQVWVQFDSEKKRICRDIRSKLNAEGLG